MAEVPAQTVLNEAALKRFDPYIKEVLDTAKYVALYRFNNQENEWEKTNVEGSLFVYSRSGQPFHNILVLNRLSRDNLVEPITCDLDLQLQEPFLLYRNGKLTIYGIWFYEKAECTRLTALIKRLMKQAGGELKMDQKNRMNGGENHIDLYSMLTKAQETFNSHNINKPSNSSKNSTKSSPQFLEEAPRSVVEFFASANAAPPATTKRPSNVIPQADLNDKNTRNPVNPILHQLMANSVHTVEHIEKQQRSVTPQSSENTNVMSYIREIASRQLSDSDNVTTSEENSSTTTKTTSSTGESKDVMFMNPTPLSIFLQPIKSPFDIKQENTAQTSETPEKPALMPPAMFTPSTSGLVLLNNDLKVEDAENNKIKVEPLTKKQLLQAINYLLKNDPDFVTKIHEAYVKSLREMVL